MLASCGKLWQHPGGWLIGSRCGVRIPPATRKSTKAQRWLALPLPPTFPQRSDHPTDQREHAHLPGLFQIAFRLLFWVRTNKIDCLVFVVDLCSSCSSCGLGGLPWPDVPLGRGSLKSEGSRAFSKSRSIARRVPPSFPPWAVFAFNPSRKEVP